MSHAETLRAFAAELAAAGVRDVVVCPGSRSAPLTFALARRLMKENRKAGTRHVEVFVPRHAGTDWADVWRSRLKNTEHIEFGAQAPK